MPRFKWNDPKKGRLINKYIGMICTEYPTIAKDVAKHGIGDLNFWFNDYAGETHKASEATCGCLVGTTALVAMARLPSIAEQIDTDTSDAPLVLYNLLVKKSKRDISKYTTVAYSINLNKCIGEGSTVRKNADPLLLLIYDAGMAASDEAQTYNSLSEDRERQVVAHMEMRIRRNLGLPHPLPIKVKQ